MRPIIVLLLGSENSFALKNGAEPWNARPALFAAPRPPPDAAALAGRTGEPGEYCFISQGRY